MLYKNIIMRLIDDETDDGEKNVADYKTLRDKKVCQVFEI